MSITAFQERIKGCLPVVAIAMAAVFVGSMFYNCGEGGEFGQGEGSQDAIAADTLGTAAGVPLTGRALEEQEKQILARYSMGGDVTPDLQALAAAQALNALVDQANMVALARRLGIKFTDDELRTGAQQALNQQLEQQRLQLSMMGTLKPNATDADFEAEVKKATGQTIAQLRARQLEDVNKALEDKARRPLLEQALAQPLVLAALKAQVRAPEEEVRRSFDAWTVKRILLRDRPNATETAAARAQKVQAELQKGLTFEQAMDRYSDEPPLPKKRVSEKTDVLYPRDLATNPEMRKLLSLKPGQVSEPVRVPEGTAIYKLISVKSELPKDFDKNKARYAASYADTMAQARLQEELQKMREGGGVTWQSPGYAALYALGRALENRTAASDAKALEERLRPVIAQAQQALQKGEPRDQRPAALALYAASSTLYNAPGADKAKLRPERIKALEAVLQNSEGPALRLELAELYEADKNGALAAQNLLSAAQTLSDTSTMGQQTFDQIARRLSSLQAAKLIAPDQVQDVQKEMERWRQAKAEADKLEAEARQQEEDARKKAEAEAKADKGKKSAPTVRDLVPDAPKGR